MSPLKKEFPEAIKKGEVSMKRVIKIVLSLIPFIYLGSVIPGTASEYSFGGAVVGFIIWMVGFLLISGKNQANKQRENPEKGTKACIACTKEIDIKADRCLLCGEGDQVGIVGAIVIWIIFTPVFIFLVYLIRAILT